MSKSNRDSGSIGQDDFIVFEIPDNMMLTRIGLVNYWYEDAVKRMSIQVGDLEYPPQHPSSRFQDWIRFDDIKQGDDVKQTKSEEQNFMISAEARRIALDKGYRYLKVCILENYGGDWNRFYRFIVYGDKN